MQAVGRLGSYITRGMCTVSGPFLPFGGAVDIVVVQQKDGSFKSSPWYIRFGKLHKVLKQKEKEKVEVNISVDGVEPDFHMYLNHKGEAFFLHSQAQGEEREEEEQQQGESILYYPSSGDDTVDIQPRVSKRQFKSKSCNFDSNSDAQVDKVVARTSSRRSRILGLVRSFKGDSEDGDNINRVDSFERAEIAANLLELKWSTNLTFDQLPRRDRRKTRGGTLDNGLHPRTIKEEACSCSKQDGISPKSDSDEVLCLSSARCGVLHAATVLLPEVSQTDVYDVSGVGNLAKFRKSQTINIGRRDCSVKKVRANTPTSEQLASLNLKEGRNTVTFSFSTPMLGKQQVDARIYLWKWNTRIVISDVDGTITRSDVLGQFMPLVGIDWSQTGVAHLFSDIKENGYQLLFLSARAISQASHTRNFLFNLKQDGKVLPDGPVVISPDGLFPSLYREG
ncbi:phosphatidate phosphatase PAH2-like isoform X2 [Gastrolobium bilobum]|uniref:phosphatidate phosphatase PAH2-like isoform X2 n=1 Tax=Gastrolobium bilobum TaxID=150636 RepID=UPI002AB0D124|nr:phosphatidate phosphatase PAH2-like isoform X2 [Gastrolobium bilobum]